jgi:hypothetical protein
MTLSINLDQSQDSSFSVETGLWAGQPGFKSWQGQNVSLFLIVQTSSEAPAFYPVGTENPFSLEGV